MQVEKSNIKQDFTMDNDSPSNEYIYRALQEAINDIIKRERYVTYTVHRRILNGNGDSFLGALCEVNIKGVTDQGENKTNIFLKIRNPDIEITFIDIAQAYFTELYIYKELSNIYANLQEEFKVPSSERYRVVKFFNVCNQDVIALENMKEQGFATYHRTEMVSLHFGFIQLALMELAKFHALSFVLEHKRPMYFEKKKKVKIIIDSVLIFNEEWGNHVDSLTKTAIKFVDEDVEIKLTKFVENLDKNYEMHLKDENTVRCLCHGDKYSSY